MENKKVLLITGATRGIGLKTALRFAKEGYILAINDLDEVAGETTIAQLKQEGYEAGFFKADVTDEAQVNGMVQAVVQKYGRIDTLVNNAGSLVGRCPVEEMSTDFWNKVLNLNLLNPFYCTRATIPHLKKMAAILLISPPLRRITAAVRALPPMRWPKPGCWRSPEPPPKS